jgi:ubiquinone/menaquinone biosynthesis C-methylase UbiE
MTESFYKTKLTQSVLAKRRKIRADFVLSKVNIFPGMSILDVGCGPNGRSFEDFISKDYRIVGIDLLDAEDVRIKHPNFRYWQQDAQDLSIFRDKEFDLAVSFGMMEHICDLSVLKRMYSEINRVAQQWLIVVPWKYVFVEPHFKFPFFQLLPYALKVFLTKSLNLHDLRRAVNQDYNYIRNHYQWLTNSQWIGIFEGGCCYRQMDSIAIVKRNIPSNVV